MENSDFFDLINSVPCGTTISHTVTAEIKRKCFSFKKMFDGGDSVIIDKEEWEQFLETFGIRRTNEPCQ